MQESKSLPDVIVVRKYYPDKKKRRIWKLKELNKETNDKAKTKAEKDKEEKDKEEFMNMLDEEP